VFRLPAAALCLALATPLGAQTADEIEAARGLFREGQFEAALEVLEPAAEAGDAAAQNALGNAYHHGRGREVDAAQAIAWYEKSRAQGNPLAAYNLARLHRFGMAGQPPDMPRALALFTEAAEAGFAYAHGDLGRMHELGLGTPIDYAKAADHYARAEGNVEATVDLGALYLRGDGVAEDGARARELFKQAADQGHARGATALAQMYDFGLSGTEPDHALAHQLYLQGANGGYAYAGQLLSNFLSSSERPGPWHDPTRGHAWCLWALEAAAPEEAPNIAPHCEAQAARLSDEALEEARALAATL